MKIKALFKQIDRCQIKGSKETSITGVCADSKRVSPGNLFIAKRGAVFDGNDHIVEAQNGGAVAVLTDIYNPFLKNIVQIIHPNVNEIEPLVASIFYGFPGKTLTTLGVTGTNGKTTTCYILRHLLSSIGTKCGMLGSIECDTGVHSYNSTHTTADVTTNHKLMREMVSNQCEAVVMEVTSHALKQGRVDEIPFDIALFTNLSQDHLDYHGDMESYAAAKKILFTKLEKGGKAVVNGDDPRSKEMTNSTKGEVITFGLGEGVDLQARDIELSLEKTLFEVVTASGERAKVEIPLIGEHNVYNTLGAIASLLSLKIPLEQLIEPLRTLPPVPGRFEPVENELGIHLFVDYSHTDHALLNALQSLQAMKRGKVITLFGCGGDRDRGKRVLMAQAAEKLSDSIIVTSDNPRSEDPEKICQEIIAGFSENTTFKVIVDRREAIDYATEIASPGDVVLIAGKGHESYQIIGNQVFEFDDRVVATESCRKKSPVC